MTLHIRTAVPQDARPIIQLAEEAGMGALSTIESSLVAEEGGHVLGFVRVTIIGGIAYVNPIVVASKARKRGIGRTLMDAARDTHRELRFVARGGALPFYEMLGCERIDWADIADEIARDCPACKDLATCNPVPMRYR